MNDITDVIKDLMVLASDVGNLRGENRMLKQENEFLRNMVAPLKAAESPATDRQQAKHEICTCEVLSYNHTRSQVTLLVNKGCAVHDV
jgi:regulator of replication initiation timing